MLSLRSFFAFAMSIPLFASVSCVSPGQSSKGSVSAEAIASNPLLADWVGPHGGVPAFDKVKLEHFKPALDVAMKEARREYKAIADNSQPPTFENVFGAWERSGQLMARVMAVYSVWSANLSTPEFQKIEQEMAPKLAAFQDEIMHNRKLFERVDAVYTSPEFKRLTPEQQRLGWFTHTRFVLAGARLTEKQKADVARINQRLAEIGTSFSQNVLADEEKQALVLEKESDLAGLPTSFVESAAAEAERRGMKGKWVVANTRSAMEPFLTYSSDRALREKAYRIWMFRGDLEGPTNNNKIVAETLKLRAQRSKLLGFPTYAHWALADRMAKEPQAAMDLMMRVWKPAVAAATKDIAEMQKLVDREKGGFKIAVWDHRYYAEKIRKAKYALDFDRVKPHLRLEKVQEAMFWVAGELYGFKFKRLNDVPVFHPDVEVYEVTGRDGKAIGLWYFDPYARAGKNSGAWMTAYREQSRLDGKNVLTLVSNNSNIIKGKAGEPALMTWDDATTMFHEFGHALHGLSSNVTYPSLSGTNTARDFVEFPSQIHEHFIMTPQVLKFLTDVKGRPMPKELVKKIQRAKTFNQGFETVEYLASAIVDMKLHLAGETDIDPKAFEEKTLTDLGMPKEIVMRHRIPHFGHVFSGEGYSAGYYSYLWAQVLDKDAYEAFVEAGNPYDRKTSKRLFENLLSVGNTVDPAEAFKRFRGREPKVDALLRSRGFPVETKTIQ